MNSPHVREAETKMKEDSMETLWKLEVTAIPFFLSLSFPFPTLELLVLFFRLNTSPNYNYRSMDHSMGLCSPCKFVHKMEERKRNWDRKCKHLQDFPISSSEWYRCRIRFSRRLSRLNASLGYPFCSSYMWRLHRQTFFLAILWSQPYYTQLYQCNLPPQQTGCAPLCLFHIRTPDTQGRFVLLHLPNSQTPSTIHVSIRCRNRRLYKNSDSHMSCMFFYSTSSIRHCIRNCISTFCEWWRRRLPRIRIRDKPAAFCLQRPPNFRIFPISSSSFLRNDPRLSCNISLGRTLRSLLRCKSSNLGHNRSARQNGVRIWWICNSNSQIQSTKSSRWPKAHYSS